MSKTLFLHLASPDACGPIWNPRTRVCETMADRANRVSSSASLARMAAAATTSSDRAIVATSSAFVGCIARPITPSMPARAGSRRLTSSASLHAAATPSAPAFKSACCFPGCAVLNWVRVDPEAFAEVRQATANRWLAIPGQHRCTLRRGARRRVRRHIAHPLEGIEDNLHLFWRNAVAARPLGSQSCDTFGKAAGMSSERRGG